MLIAISLPNSKEKVIEIEFQAQLFVKIVCLPCYSIVPVQQQRDIPEVNVPYAPRPDDQIVFDFAQAGAPDSNLYAAVHKHPRQAPVETDQPSEYQAFDT